MRTLVGGLVLMLVAAAAPATADHSPYCPNLQEIPGTGPVNVMLDEFNSGGYVTAFFVYAESNGQDGTQRHDAYCGDTENGDTVVFGVMWERDEAPEFHSDVLP